MAHSFDIMFSICLFLIVFWNLHVTVQESIGDDVVDKMAKKVAIILRKHIKQSLPAEELQSMILQYLAPEIKSLKFYLERFDPLDIIRLQKQFTEEVLTMSGLNRSDLGLRSYQPVISVSDADNMKKVTDDVRAVIFG